MAAPLGDAEAQTRFAAAVGSAAAGGPVVGFQRVSFPGVAALSECWVGVGTVRGDPQAWLVPVAASGAPGAAIALPIGGQVALLARLDLQGAPRKIDLTRPPGGPPLDPLPGAALAAPALLLSVGHQLKGGEERSTLALVQVAPTAGLRWQEIASSVRPQSEGHRSFSLELVPDPGQPWLALSLYQTSVPAASGPPGMPGPPLRLHFGWRGSEYRRLS